MLSSVQKLGVLDSSLSARTSKLIDSKELKCFSSANRRVVRFASNGPFSMRDSWFRKMLSGLQTKPALRSYEFDERPFWRPGESPATSEMLSKVFDFMARYESLTQDEKAWVESVYRKEALGSFLFQVNKIEGEGLETYEETQEAISEGVLTGKLSREGCEELEAVYCLNRALEHALEKSSVSFSVDRILEAHGVLMSSTNPEFAGRFRNSEEIVYVRRVSGDAHIFMWPTEIQRALRELVARTNKELEEVRGETDANARAEQLLKLGGRFFMEFENIHPFVDGNGRIGRLLLAAMLKVLMPFPNVLYVEGKPEEPPFVEKSDYLRCFELAQAKQELPVVKFPDGRTGYEVSKEAAVCEVYEPKQLLSLIIEGVYVGWKRLFDAFDKR